MIPISDVRSQVAMHVANCPNPLIDKTIIAAARELCNAAAIWQTTITLYPDDFDDVIDITSPERLVYGVPWDEFHDAFPHAWSILYADEDNKQLQGELVRIIGVTVNDRPFNGYWLTSNREFHMRVKPDSPVSINAQIRPYVDAKELPETVASNYHDGLVSGALSRLLLMNGQMWANPELARYHSSQFRYWRTQAIAGANQTRAAPGKPCIQPRRFAAF